MFAVEGSNLDIIVSFGIMCIMQTTLQGILFGLYSIKKKMISLLEYFHRAGLKQGSWIDKIGVSLLIFGWILFGLGMTIGPLLTFIDEKWMGP